MRRRGAALALAAPLLAAAVPGSMPVAAPVALAEATLYPRLIALRHNRALGGRLLLATLAGLRQSRDEGRSWQHLSPVPEPAGTTERCCGTIYELPRRVGGLPAGTLLYAATYHLGKRTVIRIFRSDDGRVWRPHSEIAQGGSFGKGVWEPHFDLSADGALVVFWSDEADPCCSQRLRRARSRDGRSWIDIGDLVRGRDPADRPGMATTARMLDGRYAMTYEMCGPQRCTVFIRFSADGWNYGDPEAPGIRIETAAGQHLEHAPTVTAAGNTLLVVGQMVMEANGAVSPLNGRVILRGDGAGPWRTVPAPVPVPSAYDNYCPNYSSALLPRDEDGSLVMIASAYDADRRCRAYMGRARLRGN